MAEADPTLLAKPVDEDDSGYSVFYKWRHPERPPHSGFLRLLLARARRESKDLLFGSTPFMKHAVAIWVAGPDFGGGWDQFGHAVGQI